MKMDLFTWLEWMEVHHHELYECIDVMKGKALTEKVQDSTGFASRDVRADIIQKNLCMTGEITHCSRRHWSVSIFQTRYLSLLLSFCFSICILCIFSLANVLIRSCSLPCDRSFPSLMIWTFSHRAELRSRPADSRFQLDHAPKHAGVCFVYVLMHLAVRLWTSCVVCVYSSLCGAATQ